MKIPDGSHVRLRRSEMLDWILKADGDILLFLQNYVRNALTDGFWKLITFLGDGGWFWIATGILLLFFAKTRKAGVTALLALLLGALVTNLLLKNLLARPRPYDKIAGLTPLVKKLKDYSFPSGHTCASFAAAVVYWKMLPKVWGRAGVILAFLIAFSRLYVGVHYPTDVLAGGIIGGLMGLLAVYIIKHIRPEASTVNIK